jgi:hypothetical protein
MTRAFTRQNYVGTGTIQNGLGTFDVTGSYSYFDRWVHTASQADASVPA